MDTAARSAVRAGSTRHDPVFPARRLDTASQGGLKRDRRIAPWRTEELTEPGYANHGDRGHGCDRNPKSAASCEGETCGKTVHDHGLAEFLHARAGNIRE